jgi:hypothetical protein
MRAKFVYESLEFERGKDPKESMGIGMSPNKRDFSSEEEIIKWIIFYKEHPELKPRFDSFEVIETHPDYHQGREDKKIGLSTWSNQELSKLISGLNLSIGGERLDSTQHIYIVNKVRDYLEKEAIKNGAIIDKGYN